MTAALIVSLAGIDDAGLDDWVRLVDELDARRVPASWLLPPRPRDGRHHPDAPAIEWLRSRVDVGDALVMHGYDHTCDPLGCWEPNSVARLRRRAEFAALPAHEAALRLIAAVRALDELGLRTDVFAAPKGQASAGTLVALRRRGFRSCVEGAGVRLLGAGRAVATGDTLVRGRLLGVGWVGAPDQTESWRCRALVLASARSARQGRLTRIGVRPADLRRPATRAGVLAAVDAALAARARPVTYRAPSVLAAAS